MTVRAQSNVVGVALLLVVTVGSLGMVTAGVGSILEASSTQTQLTHVTNQFVTVFPSDGTPGRSVEDLRVTGGELETVSRQVRIHGAGDVVWERDVQAIVYHRGSGRVASVAGAVVRGATGSAELVRSPPISWAGTNESRSVYVAVPVVVSHPSRDIDDASRLRVTVVATVNQSRTLAAVNQLSFETATPAAMGRWFRERGHTAKVRDIDGDGVDSVVVEVAPETTVYLVVLRTEVTVDG